MKNRRSFLKCIPLLAVPGLAAQAFGAPAAPPARILETDPLATAVGYRHDATKVDATRFPAHEPGQICSGCALYQGKPGAAWARCAAVGGKQVKAKGWCMVYNPKS